MSATGLALAVIFSDLPILNVASTVTLAAGVKVAITPHQPVCWVSLTPAGLPAHPPQARPFPAVIDTGFNHNFLLRSRQFRARTGYELTLDDFPIFDRLRTYGRRADLHEADLWLHPNVPGHRDQISRRPPIRLEMNLGVAVSPLADQPRLPLLGMLSIRENGLQLLIDGAQGRMSLRTDSSWVP